MPDYLWTARLEAAAKARNVSLASPKPWRAKAPTAASTGSWGLPPSFSFSILFRREGK